MSEQNVAAVRGVYERWGEAGFPASGTYLGVDRIRDYTRGFLEPWTRITIEAEELLEAAGLAE
jgi:hypothetical protein